MGDTTLRPRKAWLNRTRAAGRATIATIALFGVALPASALADHPGAGGGADSVPAAVKRALGGEVTVLDNDLYRVESPRGFTFTTHGPDPKTDEVESSLTPGQPERVPVCIANPATDYYQEVLYGYPSTGTNDVATQRPVIQAQVRRNNWLINDASVASGGPQADFKVRCEADSSIRVTAFPVTPDGSGTNASFSRIVSAAKAAGFGNGSTDTNVDYTIFYDGNGSACGVGYFYSDESLSVNNVNNNPGNEAGYGVSYRSCWFGRTSIHENAHNQGAAQYSAPNSTGSGAHCNERNDILCYVDGGDRNQSLVDCPITPPSPSDWFYDCDWNTYFDAAPEGGEWLASHWNIGSPVNRFIAFAGPDTISPETTISGGPTGPTNNPHPSFTLISSEGGGNFQCSLAAPGSPSFVPCTSPKSYSGLADGAYEFQAAAIDAVGNVDQTPEVRSFTVDTAVPDTQIDSGPPSAIATSSTSFSFSAAGGESATFECSVDLAVFTSCTSPLAVGGLSDGVHAFAVRATDGAGNADPSPAEHLFAIDTTAPDTSITNGPPAKLRVRKKANVSFAFGSPETAAKFQCSFDNSPFASCSSPQKYSGVKRGTHQFLVRAIDAVGNVDQTPAADSFKVKKKRRRR